MPIAIFTVKVGWGAGCTVSAGDLFTSDTCIKWFPGHYITLFAGRAWAWVDIAYRTRLNDVTFTTGMHILTIWTILKSIDTIYGECLRWTTFVEDMIIVQTRPFGVLFFDSLHCFKTWWMVKVRHNRKCIHPIFVCVLASIVLYWRWMCRVVSIALYRASVLITITPFEFAFPLVAGLAMGGLLLFAWSKAVLTD